jgi:hypothetical protein
MLPARSADRYTGLRHQVKVHSFRTLTVVLAWVLIVAAFYQKPELLTGVQRAISAASKPSAITFLRRRARESSLFFGRSVVLSRSR